MRTNKIFSTEQLKTATIWWESLQFKDRQTRVNHYCTGNEISTMELTMNDIVLMWENQIVKDKENYLKSFLKHIKEFHTDDNGNLQIFEMNVDYSKTYDYAIIEFLKK